MRSAPIRYICRIIVDFMALIIPEKYKQKLLPETTEVAIKQIKDSFQTALAASLRLRRVTAPLFVLSIRLQNGSAPSSRPTILLRDSACIPT